MGTHITSCFQKQVEVNGKIEWDDILSNFDDPQNYNLFAWLGDVRNYNGITPIAQLRGCPPDLKLSYEEQCMDDSPNHWLLGSEIIDAIELIQPVVERGVINNWTHFDGTEPDTYSRSTDKAAFTMDSPQVKRDSGYAAHLWDNCCNFRKYDWKCNPHMGATIQINGGWKMRTPRCRPSVKKHADKLRKYLARVGNFRYVAEWTVSPEQRLKEFGPFINEVHRLMSLHGEIRMVMSFT